MLISIVLLVLSPFIKTPEDIQNLRFYEAAYARNEAPLEGHAVPKKLHFIWLGADPFPEASLKRVKKWVGTHPDWECFFWMDSDNAAPYAGGVKRSVRDFSFEVLQACYDAAENRGEKARILGFEILLQEGGVLIDHDVNPLGKIPHEGHDFFCPLEAFQPTVLSSSVYPASYLIAARPRHPILKAAADWLASRWKTLDEQFPGADAESVYNRVMHRTSQAFIEGVKLGMDQPGNRDLVYIEMPFAQHLQLHTWLPNESVHGAEDMAQVERLNMRCDRALLLMLVAVGCTLPLWWRRKT